MTDTPSTVVKVRGIAVDYFITDDDLAMLKVNPHTLDDMWKEHPSTVAYFGNLHGRAIAQQGRIKTQRDMLFGAIAEELRKAAAERGEKVPSEAKIETEVRKDRRFIAISEAYAEAQGVVTALEAANLAARARKDSLRHFSDQKMAEGRTSGSYGRRDT